jgi:hypothetical protein
MNKRFHFSLIHSPHWVKGTDTSTLHSFQNIIFAFHITCGPTLNMKIKILTARDAFSVVMRSQWLRFNGTHDNGSRKMQSQAADSIVTGLRTGRPGFYSR